MVEDDPVLAGLQALHDSLARDADAAGEGPNTKRKSEFRSEKERADFIDAWGVDAYKNLQP